jgi:hypothetical protein
MHLPMQNFLNAILAMAKLLLHFHLNTLMSRKKAISLNSLAKGIAEKMYFEKK